MSTVTIEAPNRAPNAPEWRRICHVYTHGTVAERSLCGTATWKPGEGHDYAACGARGHSICVVCLDIWYSVDRPH